MPGTANDTFIPFPRLLSLSVIATPFSLREMIDNEKK